MDPDGTAPLLDEPAPPDELSGLAMGISGSFSAGTRYEVTSALRHAVSSNGSITQARRWRCTGMEPDFLSDPAADFNQEGGRGGVRRWQKSDRRFGMPCRVWGAA
jgi:hypothetical protein